MFLRFAALSFLFALPLAFAQPVNSSGIQPRATAADYPARDTVPGVTIAADVVPHRNVPKLLAGKYVVMEIAVFPENGALVTITPDNFRLRIGADHAILRPVAGADIALATQQHKDHTKDVPGRVTVYNGATVGYETGSPNRRGGVYTGAEVGVAVGNPPPPPPPPPDTVDAGEVINGELPATKTRTPIAGYLYFKKPVLKQKSPTYALTYYGTEGQIHLTVPAPAKR